MNTEDFIREWKLAHRDKKHDIICGNCGNAIDNPSKPCSICVPKPQSSIDGIPRDLYTNDVIEGYEDNERKSINP